MNNTDAYSAALDEIASGVSGFIGASIVDLDSGMPLASRTTRPDFDLEVASAYNSEMVKAKLNTIKVLGIQTHLEDMLLTLGDQLHLIKLIGGGSVFVYVAADRGQTNLALLRQVVNRTTAKLD